MTETLKVDLDEELVKKFKRKAFETYGYKKGSLKKAMEQILKSYTSENTAKWDGLVGVLSERKEKSVELQHKAWNKAKLRSKKQDA